MTFNLQIPDVRTYSNDGRIEIGELYNSLLHLNSSLWEMEIIFQAHCSVKGKEIIFPVLTFRTKKKGNALWIISGIHGEEPAGPNAIARNISFLNSLAKKIPVVLLPLCNPIGYVRNWRYFNSRRTSRKINSHSVGDSEHFLLNENRKGARLSAPTSEHANALTSYVLKISKQYAPVLVLDFHEDESLRKLYIYSQGILGAQDPIARNIVSILKKHGASFYEYGKTRFGEKIINGIVGFVKDGSIDELLSSEKIVVNGKIVGGPSAKSVIVVETNTFHFPLKKRVEAHTTILKNAGKFFQIAKKIKVIK